MDRLKKDHARRAAGRGTDRNGQPPAGMRADHSEYVYQFGAKDFWSFSDGQAKDFIFSVHKRFIFSVKCGKVFVNVSKVSVNVLNFQ
jgi:hypothetical protein